MRKHNLAFIDTESTGLNVLKHEIIEIGCVITSPEDRKSTRLNSSHQITSYAVFSLKKNRWPSIPHFSRLASGRVSLPDKTLHVHRQVRRRSSFSYCCFSPSSPLLLPPPRHTCARLS